jgi:CelD/BcsL family acetyltransferase involved in cellulose biosynthesis
LPIYFNTGKTLTKGISYSYSQDLMDKIKKKVFLIYDVPTFVDLELNSSNNQLKLTRIPQYPGYLVDLENYTDFNQYFSATFSKSSRYKLSKYKKRLESSFDISYTMYYGEMAKDNYDSIFIHFKYLLEKRFKDKEISNNNLDPEEWKFYEEVAYPMILEKKASLFVIYNNNIPVGITLNYFSKNILFDAITVFDIDYEKFHLGSVTIMKLIEWTIENRFRYFDFSKGYYDYKKRWANKEYYFEYHLYHDPNSIRAKFLSYLIINYFSFKNFLREKNLNEAYHKFTYRLKRDKTNSKNNRKKFEYEQLVENYEISRLTKIEYNSDRHAHLKSLIFDFLYLNPEKEKEVGLYKLMDTENYYIIVSKNLQHRVIIL